jgi:hypothetical protein
MSRISSLTETTGVIVPHNCGAGAGTVAGAFAVAADCCGEEHPAVDSMIAIDPRSVVRSVCMVLYFFDGGVQRAALSAGPLSR